MRAKSLAAIVAPVVLALGGVLVARSLAVQSAFHEIPGPRAWVPFSADVRVTFPGSSTVITGRFFRSSDGSGRLETAVTGRDSKDQLVSINNLPAGMSYVGRGLVWKSFASRGLSKPARWRAGTPGLTKLAQRIALVGDASATSGSDLKLVAEGGYEAYRWATGSLDCILIPSLNFFPVVRNSLLSGRREVYSNIAIGEPPREIFGPPLGVTVEPYEGLSGGTRATDGLPSGSPRCETADTAPR
jgi:hypothetical protein